MNTQTFLTQVLEDVNPGLVLGTANTPLDFIDISIDQFSKINHKVFKKYGVKFEIKHLYMNTGIIELSKQLDSLVFQKQLLDEVKK